MRRTRPGTGLTGAAALAAVALLAAACTGSGPGRQPAAARATVSSAATSSTPAPAPSSSTPAPTVTSTRPAPRSTTRRPPHPVAAGRTATRPPGHRLPLALPTGDASQVISVVAPSAGSTRGTLQAWRKVSGGWARVGPPVPAWLGSDGLSRHPNESISATPIGSFTLTQAFGRDSDPGTRLPYTQTTPDDWWISQPGPLYNTRQRCAAQCGFTRGDPNEHLYYETPYYDYAVVIDYNTRNAPGGVRQGAGSAFFLHVTVGEPTAGCVSIPGDQLVRIMRWLAPARHPRILIGVG